MRYDAQPPRAVEGSEYPLLVPTVDSDGNEVAGIRLPEIAVPRATYTGWNLRHKRFAEDALMLVGARFPFAETRAERQKSGDPRPSLEERYPTRAHFVAAWRDAAETLSREGFLLEEDLERYLKAAEALGRDLGV